MLGPLILVRITVRGIDLNLFVLSVKGFYRRFTSLGKRIKNYFVFCMFGTFPTLKLKLLPTVEPKRGLHQIK